MMSPFEVAPHIERPAITPIRTRPPFFVTQSGEQVLENEAVEVLLLQEQARNTPNPAFTLRVCQRFYELLPGEYRTSDIYLTVRLLSRLLGRPTVLALLASHFGENLANGSPETTGVVDVYEEDVVLMVEPLSFTLLDEPPTELVPAAVVLDCLHNAA